jgi:uncharacterized membrane protein YbhN (UPF0104 family)
VRRLLREHPTVLLPFVAAVAVAGLLVVSYFAGFERVLDDLPRFHPGWLAVAAAGQLVGMAAYVIAYRHVVAHEEGPRISSGLASRLVAAGFGAIAVGGGFALDRRALRNLCGDSAAVSRVAALGALEWALLAPLACACAIAMVLSGGEAHPSLLWPWILGVPLGFGLALPIATEDRARRLQASGRGWRLALGNALMGLRYLRRFVLNPHRSLSAWCGITIYWIADMSSFYAGLRAFGLAPDFVQLVLAYATGYVATRRSLPLGGVGVTEALLALSVSWVGLPLAAAIPGVAAYRLFSLVMPTVPALLTHGALAPLLHGPASSKRARVPGHGRPAGTADWRLHRRAGTGEWRLRRRSDGPWRFGHLIVRRLMRWVGPGRPSPEDAS